MSDHVNVHEADEGVRTVSPIKKNAQGKRIRSPQKKMIVNMYKELKSKYPKMYYKKTIFKISETLGIGHNSVTSIIAEYKSSGKCTFPNKTRNITSRFDDLDRDTLRHKINTFWLRMELPTIDKILRAVNDDPALPTIKRSSMYDVLKKLDFVFINKKRCSVLTESEDVLVWRQNYLYDIRKFREDGRTIYYLGETWLNAGDCVENLWVDKTVQSKHHATNPTGKGKRLILLHIGSHKGFLDGGLLSFVSKKNSLDYHDEINGDNFQEWFESIIPRLDPYSVIVMDNAPYHSVREETIPTSSWKKEDIFSWLTSKGIVIHSKMYKPQLLSKVRENKAKYMSYVVDEMAKAAGHSVLRLPPSYCEFNPIDLAWGMVKGYVKEHNTTYKMKDVKALLNIAIERVTSDNWKNFICRVKTEENKISAIDSIMDKLIDNLEP